MTDTTAHTQQRHITDLHSQLTETRVTAPDHAETATTEHGEQPSG